jgi:cytochrome c oxidase subunit II
MVIMSRLVPLLLLVLLGCGNASGVINPRGPIAAHINELWWILLIVAVLVCAPVLGLLFYALFHARTPGTRPHQDLERRLVVGGGLVMPLIVLSAVFVMTIRSTVELSRNPETDLTIQVLGHQWWWEITYPELGVVTANEVYIPTGRNVRVELNTADVIHSFWVPELSGKVDLIPNHTTELWLNADASGAHLGFCAEFCGLQHALMKFQVIAVTPQDFDAWAVAQKSDAATPVETLAQRGMQVFLSNECGTCHNLRGTEAQGGKGPDLTHFASRRTIAAGTLKNTPDELERWIREPEKIKRGTTMPPTPMSDQDMQALLAYMETLR